MFRIIFLTLMLLCSGQSNGAIVVGNPKGTVTMIEVYDLSCGHCHKMYPIVQKIIDKNPNLKVRLMPVAIINRTSLYEGAAAIAATHYNGKFQEFNNFVMTSPPLNNQEVTDELVRLGLHTPKFIKLMHSAFVKKQMMEGLNFLKVEHSGTPLFIIYPSANPKVSAVLKGEQSYQTMQKVIDNANSH